MTQSNDIKHEDVENHNIYDPKWERRAKRIAWIVGGIGVGLTLGAIPFITPAIRRYCLPYVPATPRQINTLKTILRGKSGKVADLGSGDGRVVISLAKEGHYVLGYELNLWLVLISRVSSIYNGVYRNTEFHRKDLWKVDLKEFDNIIFFGVDQMMKPLGDKIYKQARPGTCIISCRFRFPQWKPIISYDEGADSVWMYEKH